MPSLTHESIKYERVSPATSSQLSQPSGEIQFVSGHFGYSSEEEEEFADGLTFEKQSQQRLEREAELRRRPPPATTETLPAPVVEGINSLLVSAMTQNAGSVITSLGQNLLASVMGQAQQLTSESEISKSRAKEETDDDYNSELDDGFEVISDDDLQ